LLAGAVSHEIRNLCSATSVVCSNLAKSSALATNPDFEALCSLVGGLTRIASIELRRDPVQSPAVDLRTVLDQLLIVIEPDWSDVDGEVDVRVPDDLPQVAADPHEMLQIFLNLTQNSCRAAGQQPIRKLTITAEADEEFVTVRFTDTGRGVQDASILFQPFRAEADGTGFGLYISRALARSFGGDLNHVAVEHGARFDVLLPRGVAGR